MDVDRSVVLAERARPRSVREPPLGDEEWGDGPRSAGSFPFRDVK